MRTRIIVAFLTITILSVFPLIHYSVFAEETIKDTLTKKYNQEKDICKVVKQTLTAGMNTKEVTKASIQLGHDACLVVRCAIEANGSLEQIITGALEAGTSSDVCSRCAIEAGADPAAVAKALEKGLGYSPPLAAGLPRIEIGLPGGNRGSGTISPASPASP